MKKNVYKRTETPKYNDLKHKSHAGLRPLKTLMTSGSEVALLGDMSFLSGQEKNDEAKTVGSFANMP